MQTILKHLGWINDRTPRGLHLYSALCFNGEVLALRERDYYRTGTIVDISDDMVQPNSGWVHWVCEACGADFSTRTRPGGKVVCPCCFHEEVCPESARMLAYEGAIGDCEEDYMEA